MNKSSLLSLPTELLQQVAISAHTTRDALAFAHSNKALHSTVATTSVFRTRLLEDGWDTSMWDEEAIELSSNEVLRLWIQADASCTVVRDKLTVARESRYFERPDASYHVYYPRLTFPHWGSVLCDCGEDEISPQDAASLQQGQIHLIDGERVWTWMTDFSNALGHILTRSKPGVSPVLDQVISLANDGEVWKVVLRTLLGLVHNRVLTQRLVILPSDFYPDISPDLGAVVYHAFQLERSASTFAHFVLSCDQADLEHIFGAFRDEIYPSYTARQRWNNTARLTHERFFGPGVPITHDGGYPHVVAETRRFSSSFLCIVVLYLELRLRSTTRDTLSAPRPPLGRDVRMWTSLLPQHSLVGTPLAELPHDSSRQAWGGYYGFHANSLMRYRDPPMILELAIVAINSNEGILHLFGEGQDNVGPFTLAIRVARRTGLFDGIKSYTHNTTRWDWRGCVTPFGLVGRWGARNNGGPVWIWPREWSQD